MDQLTNEQNTLLSLLGHNLFSSALELNSDVDWESLAKEARVQTVFSVAFNQYKNLPLDDELAAKVKSTLMKYALSGATCFKNHTYLHELMQKHGIPYCVVKGAASAFYYPDPLSRSMGDVDFYIHPDDIDRALAVFEGEGFVRDEADHPWHIALKKGNTHFEMHFKPVAYHEGPIGDIFDEYWRDIRETAVLVETDLATYYGPSVFHHGFILLTHLHQHLFREGVGLRHFCDWALFANALSNEEFVTIFESRLKRIGLYRLAQLLSLGAVKHMGMEHKAWMGDDYEIADELLVDIIRGGNFGRKDRQRAQESMFIMDRNANNMNKGRLGSFFASMNYIVDSHWKSAKKCKLLYPIGWTYFSTRYLVRVLLGKRRKINLVGAYQKSGERRDKYSKIKVFEPEE